MRIHSKERLLEGSSGFFFPSNFFPLQLLSYLSLSFSSYGEDDDEDNDDGGETVPLPDSKKPKISSADNGLPADFFDSAKKSVTTENPAESEDAPSKGGLPAGFFDDPKMAVGVPVAPSKAAAEATEAAAVKSQSVPQGFFDDKKKDAEARNTTEKDDLGEEWDKFQKEILKDERASEVVRDEDVQELLHERDQREILEMEELWTKVERLEKQREALEKLKSEKLGAAGKKDAKDTKKTTNSQDEKDDDDDDDGEDFVDDFMNWRGKTSHKKQQ